MAWRHGHASRWCGVACMAGVMLLAAACGGRAPPQVLLAGQTMGSDWTVRLPGPLPVPAETLRRGIQQQFDAVDAALSSWREDSALSRFNDHADDHWQVLDTEFAAVLRHALELGRQSGGAYDVTVAPLVDLWGFGPVTSPRGQVPTDAAIASAMRSVGWQRVEVSADGMRARRPVGVRVDLSSLGKGRGVDCVASYLLSRGIDDFLIDLSGELRAQGRNPRGGPWRVAVEQPGPDEVSTGEGRVATRALALHDEAVATSGTYRRYFLADGRGYSHVIDPRTGRPTQPGVVSATVVAADAMQADALATLLTVLSPREAMGFAEAHQVAALLFVEQDGIMQAQASTRWKLKFENENDSYLHSR